MEKPGDAELQKSNAKPTVEHAGFAVNISIPPEDAAREALAAEDFNGGVVAIGVGFGEVVVPTTGTVV